MLIEKTERSDSTNLQYSIVNIQFVSPINRDFHFVSTGFAGLGFK